MSKRDSRERGDQTLVEAPQSDSAPVRGRGEPYRPAADEADRLRSPARREQPFEAEEDREPRERSGDDEARKSWLRRHPIAVAFGLLCLGLTLPAGYLYWDYTSHFETTDDAYMRRANLRSPRGFGLHHSGPGYRQWACGRRPGDRPHRRSHLPRSAGPSQRASGCRASQHRNRQCANECAAGPDRRRPGTAGPAAGGAGVRTTASGALPISGADTTRGQRSECPTIHLAAASAAGRGRQCASDAQTGATASRGADCATRQ